MYTNLTTELLRNFVAITDAGSMSKAADQICITQSALSLQMKRLADIVQAPIFQRHNRGMLLTDAGKTLLAYGKVMIELNDRAISAINGNAQTGPVRIGMIQDFADDLLSKVLVRIMKINPGAQIQIRIGSSSELISQLSGGLHDLVLCLGDPSDPGAVTAMQMAWLGNSQLFKEPMLPIALMEKPCVFRDAALAALEAEKRSYRIVLETPSISVLRAAVLGGAAITCRTGWPPGTDIASYNGLDLALPRVSYCVHTAPNPGIAIQRLAHIVKSALLALSGNREQLNTALL